MTEHIAGTEKYELDASVSSLVGPRSSPGRHGVLLRCYAWLNFRYGSAGRHNSFLFLEGPAGRLEALLNAGAPDAEYAAVVCHPHPVYGGTLHNKVVFHTTKALNGFWFSGVALQFSREQAEPGRTRSRRR